jgi:hypothetical protein
VERAPDLTPLTAFAIEEANLGRVLSGFGPQSAPRAVRAGFDPVKSALNRFRWRMSTLEQPPNSGFRGTRLIIQRMSAPQSLSEHDPRWNLEFATLEAFRSLAAPGAGSEFGLLGLPVASLDDQLEMRASPGNRIFTAYSDAARSPGAARLVAALNRDPRIKALEGQMLRNGHGASRFDVERLAMWVIWTMNERGAETAIDNLDNYLRAIRIPAINVLWVLGVGISEPVTLSSKVALMPIDAMPLSYQKEKYLKQKWSPYSESHPKAALTYKAEIKKSGPGGVAMFNAVEDSEFHDSTKTLYDTGYLINALDRISCVPYFSTSDTGDEVPYGLFNGSGGGTPIFDIYGSGSRNVSSSDVRELNAMWPGFTALPSKRKIRLTRALMRLCQAKRRMQIEDKILDLGIALEMILLDNANSDQLSLTLGLRGAWLVGPSAGERKHIFRLLRLLYGYRSQVAHYGLLCGNDHEKIQKVVQQFDEFADLASLIFRRLIVGPEPEWSELILGGG